MVGMADRASQHSRVTNWRVVRNVHSELAYVWNTDEDRWAFLFVAKSSNRRLENFLAHFDKLVFMEQPMPRRDGYTRTDSNIAESKRSVER